LKNKLPKVVVLRWGHRFRDERLTTHVALTARAFGSSGIILTDVGDMKIKKTIDEVVENWGGPFFFQVGTPWKMVLKDWKAVPSKFFSREISDFNVAVGNQPHSECSGLAVFLDRFFEGKELAKKFKTARLQIIPRKHGKKVVLKSKV